MAQTRKLVIMKEDHPETLLLAITTDGTMKIGLPPKDIQDNFYERAVVVGKLENVSNVLCSPEGELFCVRDGDLYRGPLPSNRDVDWFSIAKRVGKSEWNKFKILFFHPNGELYCINNEGNLYKGPQPNNENVPWMYGQATKIGTKSWGNCEALFFDPSGILHIMTPEDKIVKGNPPPTIQEYEEWLKTSTVTGDKGCLPFSHFISFSPDGKLWYVNKENGNIYRNSIPDDSKYPYRVEHLGWDYHHFRFLSFTKDKTIKDIISFEFLPEQGERVSESPEVIEEKIYNNESTSILKHNFTFEKTVKTSSSFSHEHGFTFAFGATLTFKAGIPAIAESAASVQINPSTTHKWNFNKSNETQEKFATNSIVEVLPGKAIRVVASVMKAELNVPYRAKVRTLFGFETEVKGTWNGATVYNLMVSQEDYRK